MSNNQDQIPFDNTKQVADNIVAFIKLKEAINGLNKPLNDISRNVRDLNGSFDKLSNAISTTAEETQSASKTNRELIDTTKKLTESYDLWDKAIKLVKTSFASLEGAATVGLSVLVAYGPEILNFIKSLLNGKEAVNQAALSLGTLNKALSNSNYSMAIKNINELKINVDLAKNGLLSKKEVVAQYNESLGKSMGHAKSLGEVEKKLVSDGPAYIQMTLNKAAAQIALQDAAKKAYEAEQIKTQSDDDTLSFWDKLKAYALSSTSTMGAITAQADLVVTAFEKRKEGSKKASEESDALLKIAKAFQEKAAVIAKQFHWDILSTDNNGFEKSTKSQVDYLSQAEKLRKDSLARQLQMVYEGYGAEAKAENDRYNKELASLNNLLKNKHISRVEYNKVSAQLQSEHNANVSRMMDKYNAADAEKVAQAQRELIDLQIKGMKEGADKKVAQLNQQQKQNIDQIEKQEKELEERKAKLQGQIVLALAANPNADTSALQKQLNAINEQYEVSGQKKAEIIRQTAQEIEKIKNEEAHSKLIDADQAAVDTAKNQKAKLDAERKLIFDKYQYEIDLAKDNNEKITSLIAKREEETTQLTKESEKQRADIILQTAQTAANTAISILNSNIKSQSDAKIKSLEKDKANELNNKNLTASQRKAIEDKYQKKENQEKVKAFKAEQKVQIAQAVINGAVGVQKTIAEWGMPFAIPFMIPVVAQTASQIATIASQKPPAYAKGGQFISDGRGALLSGYSRTDNTNAYLRSGEAVVVSEAMRNPWARNLVSAINVAHGGRDFSIANTGSGYAIGGIFTDGGNANRYYNQPVNDVKDLANTLAYQMINNFPPIYVDVKDVNNQQNILAQTVNRVNL